MTSRTPKEILEAARKVLEAHKKRKKPVQVVKQSGPEEAPDTILRCNGAAPNTSNEVSN